MTPARMGVQSSLRCTLIHTGFQTVHRDGQVKNEPCALEWTKAPIWFTSVRSWVWIPSRNVIRCPGHGRSGRSPVSQETPAPQSQPIGSSTTVATRMTDRSADCPPNRYAGGQTAPLVGERHQQVVSGHRWVAPARSKAARSVGGEDLAQTARPRPLPPSRLSPSPPLV